MSLILSELSGGVLTVTLNDVERKNVLSRDLVAELLEVLDAADVDDAVRVIVLTNAGNVFCAGANLSEQSEAAPAGDPNGESATPQRTRGMADVFSRFHKSPKPYVGKINGHCVAGGMGLAAALDMTVALDSAKFGFTEVRVGVAPAMISVLCLPKMRAADARAAFLRGNRFSGADAARMGLVNEAVPADEIDAAVQAIVDDLLLGGPNALAATKRLLNEVPQMGVDEAFEWTQSFSAEIFASDEAAAGMTAFLNKRTPPWVPANQE